MMPQDRRLRAVGLLGRVLICGIFVAAGLDKVRNREGTRRYMRSKNMPMSNALLGGAITMELVVAPVLALGLAPRFIAPLLSAFLIPTSLVFHDFWNRSMSVGDHRCAARKGFDHYETEWFRPIDRKKQCARTSQQLGFFNVVDFAQELHERIAHQWTYCLIKIGIVRAVDLCGNVERHSALSGNVDRTIDALLRRDAANKCEIFSWRCVDRAA